MGNHRIREVERLQEVFVAILAEKSLGDNSAIGYVNITLQQK